MAKRFRPGTVYCLRVRRRGLFAWLPARGYIGKTRYKDYRKRVEQHLFGYWYGGVWTPPKYWAADVVDYYPLYQSDLVSDWGLSLREIFFIRFLFPIHNGTHNHGNPRRVIPPPEVFRDYPTREMITAVERFPSRARRDAKGCLLPEKRISLRKDGSVQVSGRSYGRTRIFK